MPEYQEGSGKSDYTDNEPPTRPADPVEDTQDHEPGAPRPAPEPRSGEISDALSDFAQETDEDQTANEEVSSLSAPDTQVSDTPETHPLQASQAAREAAPASPALAQDQFEAGESLDVVQDATQTGRDGTADTAEEAAARHDSNRRVETLSTHDDEEPA